MGIKENTELASANRLQAKTILMATVLFWKCSVAQQVSMEMDVFVDAECVISGTVHDVLKHG